MTQPEHLRSPLRRGRGLSPVHRDKVEVGERKPQHVVYLHGGHIFASAESSAVSTIVGSCVSVCLWDGEGIGGINHYLLPYDSGHKRLGPGRFGHLAIPRLIDEMLELGSHKKNLVAKVFGGASQLGTARSGTQHVGTKNVEVAFSILAAQGIPVLSCDVGGSRGRKVVFHTADGSVLVRRL